MTLRISLLPLALLLSAVAFGAEKGRSSPEPWPQKLAGLCQQLEATARENLVEVPSGCWKVSILDFDLGRLSPVHDFFRDQFTKKPKLVERCYEIQRRLAALEEARATTKATCDELAKKSSGAAATKNKGQQGIGVAGALYQSVTAQAQQCADAVGSLTGDGTSKISSTMAKENYVQLEKDWTKYTQEFIDSGNDNAGTAHQFADDNNQCTVVGNKFKKLYGDGVKLIQNVYGTIQGAHSMGMMQKQNYERLAGIKKTLADYTTKKSTDLKTEDNSYPDSAD